MNDVVQSAVGQYEAIQAALTEGSALAIYLDWINLLSKRHPASLERHVRTMIKAVQRLHRRDDTELQRGQQGLSWPHKKPSFGRAFSLVRRARRVARKRNWVD